MLILSYIVLMSPILPLNITFLLFDGFSNMVLASAIEPLRAARDLSGKRLFSWQVASLTGGPAISSSRLAVGVDIAADRIGATDALVLVAGYRVRDHLQRDTLTLIRRKARGVPIIGALDTGAWLLAAAGLLHGRRATIHWLELDAFAEAFVDLKPVAAPYVTDGNIITCGGAQGVLAWVLDLIGQRADAALRFDVANMFQHQTDPAAPTPDRPVGRTANRILPAPLQRAILHMRQSADAPLPLPQIAEQAAVSLRTLDRLFTTTLGMSAGRYYRSIRLSHARALAMETQLTLAEIAARTGFQSAQTLARSYRQQFRQTIGQTRRPLAAGH
ncbi:GlxA family transcriptional regulator [Phaeovulum sp.]|uniref:GlxA family transcriptional regulator n=1 Tax=Phaeovulum sp. TaxID=2934796 RepID=UPI0039E21E19